MTIFRRGQEIKVGEGREAWWREQSINGRKKGKVCVQIERATIVNC